MSDEGIARRGEEARPGGPGNDFGLPVTASRGPPLSRILYPSTVRYQVLAVACSLAVLTYVQRQGFVAGTPYLKADLGLTDKQMGYLGAVWLVAYGLFQVPSGLLGDRLGARHLLTILVLGWSLLVGAAALAALFPPGGWLVFAFLVVLRFLFGLFQGGGFPGLARVVADWMPARQRGFAQGMLWAFSRLGGALAPLLVVWLITDVFGDWSIPLWILAGAGLLWAVLFWSWFRNHPSEMPQVNAAERELIEAGRPAPEISDSRFEIADLQTEPASANLQSQISNLKSPPAPLPWSRFLASRNVWALSLMYGFGGFAGNFITMLLPIYLRDHRHLSHKTTAWLVGLPLACGIVSCLLGGVVSDWLIRRTGSRKWGRRLVGSSAFALAAGACLSLLWCDEVWMLALAFSAWFFFNDATMGPAWASCADVGERYTGTLSGAMNMTGAFLGAVGIALAGTLLHQRAYDVLFLVFACSYVLASLCWLVVDVTKPLVPVERMQDGP